MSSNTNTTAGTGTADLLRTLTEDITRLVREEIQHAQNEMAGKARRAGKGAAMLGGAAILGALAAGASAAALVRSLDRVLPRSAAAALATGLYGGGAAALAVLGREEIRRAGTLAPTETVASVSEDLGAATSGLRNAR